MRPEPLFPNVGRIAKREYLERVHSKLFGVSTLLLAMLALAVALSPIALRLLDRGTTTRVAVVATDATLAENVMAAMGGILNSGAGGESAGTYELYVLPDRAALFGAESGGWEGALIVERGEAGRLEFELLTGETLGADRIQLMNLGALGVGLIDWARQAGATPAIPTFTSTAVGGPSAGGAPIPPSEYASRRIVGIVFVILIFITLVIYGMWVAAGVVAEKSSRVMEMLISAASARQLVLGKVIGLGLAGATQFVAILLPALVTLLIEDRLAIAWLGPGASIAPSLEALSPLLLLAFAGFYVLGFALYALVYAAVGSLVSRPEDLQVIALPLSIVAIVGYLQAVMALTGGTAGFVRFASLVPFWSPFVMLTRLSIGHVEPWEIVVSFGALAITIGIVAVIAIRIYAAGVLLYGQRPGLRQYVAAARRG